MTAIEFLTRAGQTNAPHREFSLILSVLGGSALVDALNNPRVSTETESSNLGPFFTEDAPEGASRLVGCFRELSPYHFPTVPLGESIASEGKGEYMYVQGQVRDTSGAPIPGAVIDTWETDDKGEEGRTPHCRFRSAPFCSFPHSTHPIPKGFYDLEYADGGVRDCRGRLVADKDGRYEYRAVVPISYPMILNVSNTLLWPPLHSSRFCCAYHHAPFAAFFRDKLAPVKRTPLDPRAT